MNIELLVLQPLCITIAVVGIGLMAIELRTRFDRSFLYFGIFLILLSAFCALDLWGLAGVTGKRWIEVQHVIFGFFSPLLYRYIYCLCKKPTPQFFQFYFYSSVVLAVLFISGIMFKVVDGVVEPTLLYLIVFLPFFIFMMITIFVGFLIKELQVAKSDDRRILFMHSIGFSILIGCGCADLFDLIRAEKGKSAGISYTIYGVICLGILLAYVFSERLVLMINERLSYIHKLKNAYIELEQAQNLSEIGKSAAMINHEIKNYMTVVLGYSRLIKVTVPMPDKEKHMLETIADIAIKLTSFSNEILDFSKAKIIKDKSRLDIFHLLQACVQSRFHQKTEAFTFEKASTDMQIIGDRGKLEQVFVNLFNNAFEAGADMITFGCMQGPNAVLLTIKDNGSGIADENIPNLFKAFHTTKTKGTGLGLPICRSIIEGHGGHISVISKNYATNNKEHGLIFNIAFPRYQTPPLSHQKDDIVLIEEGLGQSHHIASVFGNVFVNPHVIGTPEELKSFKIGSRTKIIGVSSAIRKVPDGTGLCYTLIPVSSFLARVVEGSPNHREYIFDELFIMSELLGISPE